MSDLDVLVPGTRVILTCLWYNGPATVRGKRGQAHLFEVDDPTKCTSEFKPDHSVVGLVLDYPRWRDQVLIIANPEEKYNQEIEQYYLDLL